MKKLSFILFGLAVAIIAGCSDANSCEGAKSEVLKHYKQYKNSHFKSGFFVFISIY